MKKYLTLLKRECWENRLSFFIAPIILAGLMMLVATFGNINDRDNGLIEFEMSNKGSTWLYVNNGGQVYVLAGKPREVPGGDEAVSNGLSYVGAINDALFYSIHLFALLMVIVFVSYSLTCLQDEQKSNSILFWNSFPVSHTEAVLVKLFAASALLPAITLIASMMTQVLILVVIWLRLMGTDEFGHHIWPNLHLMEAWLAHAVNILVFTLGSLSTVGLLLTISATGYRAFILLALTLLSLAVITFLITGDGMTVIRFLFTDPLLDSTSLFGSSPERLISGEIPISLFSNHTSQATETLQSQSFWLAVVIGGAMVIAAINMRKYRSEV